MIHGRNDVMRGLATIVALIALVVLTACGGGGGAKKSSSTSSTPTVVSVSSTSAAGGATLTVTITGSGTHFVQGTTTANFGAGISVNGAAAGADGSVTVLSPTMLSVQLTVAANAAAGPRTVTIKTGTEVVTLANAFSVSGPSNSAPVANPGGPYSGNVNAVISFNGSGSSDPDNDTLTYDWNFGDNTLHGTAVSPTHTYTAAGVYVVTLTVSDGKGGANAKTTTATINTPPVANAGGPYTAIQGTPLTFNGGGSTDADNDTLTFDWNFGDNTAHGANATPSHTYTSGGTFTVTLTVTDGRGGSDSKSVTVSVDRPPSASAGGPYAALVGAPISFNGSASSDADGDPLTFDWNFGDGTAHGSGVAPSHTYATGGNFTVTLTVTDGKGGSDTKTVSAAVDSLPVANPGGPYIGGINVAVTFDGSASSDPDNDPLTYAWDFGDNSTGTGAKPSHTYGAGGAYTVKLTVDDGRGGTNTKSTAASISQPPVASIGGPYLPVLNVPLTLDGSASHDPANLPITIDWNFGDGTAHANVPQPVHTYTSTGTFTITLKVTNSSSLSDTKTAQVTIDRPPVANAGGPYTVASGTPLSFNGSGSSDPDGDTLTFDWDFGDGSAHASGASPSHTYVNGGTYLAVLTATDGKGGADSKFANVTVTGTSTNNPPVAKITGPTSGALSMSYNFDASTSTDPDNDPLTFAWDFGDGGTAVGAQASHTWLTGGPFTITLTASDGKGGVNSAMQSITIKTDLVAPVVTISSPAPLKLFNAGTTDVSGTITDATDTTGLTVKVNGVDAVVSNGQFTATNVPLREGNNTITAVGSDPSGNLGTYSIAVTLDTTPPTLMITTPTAAAMLMRNSVDVSGNVNDAVPGTVNSGDVSVKVNGIDAQVSNRSFSVSGLTLVPGVNNLTAVATDKAGNTAQTQIQVNLASGTPQQHIEVLGGDSQTGVIGSMLPVPFVVQLQDENGAGIADRTITFKVSKSDGVLSVSGQQDQTINVQSDQDGKATVLFQLGTRVGVSINQVTVTSPGASGEVIFSATSTAGPPAAIQIVGGSGQTGPVGDPLPLPFAVIVYDAGGNPLQGVPVTFTSVTGGGNFGGNPTATVNTDGDGKANAVLTLGLQEGINNNVITANYAGNASAGISFMATAIAPSDPANTSISGVVLDNANTPVPNVTITIVGTSVSTFTDAQGRFNIAGAPVGTVSLFIDGRTSTRAETFPFLNFQLTTIAGNNNTLGGPIYLPEIDTVNSKIVGGSQDVVLTMQDVPGYQMTIFANSAKFPDGSTSGRMSLSQVHSDKVPMIPPNGSAPKYPGTLQPPGVIFNPPIRVQFPNTDGLAPGTVIDVYTYDHDLEQWVSQGPARVSADGSVIISDPGFGITKSGWHFAPPPPPPKTCTASCKGDECNSSTLMDPPCTCVTQPTNDGGSCGGQPQGCQDQGICVDGICTGHYKMSGTSCDDGQFCTKNDKCIVLNDM